MRWKEVLLLTILAVGQAGLAWGDELTQIVQRDLAALGYDPGAADGQVSTKTLIAVSRFQSEHGLEVTGEITPQLAGRIKAAMSQPGSTAKAAPASNPAQTQADRDAARQACLQEKIAAAQKSSQMKSGFSKLFNAVSRTASRFGGSEVASQISTTAGDAASINATLSDLEGAAKDLGISQSDIDACQNP